MIGKLISYGAAAALAAAPIAAQAAPERAPVPLSAEQEQLRGGIFLPVLIAIGLAVVIYLVIDNEKDIDVPFSP